MSGGNKEAGKLKGAEWASRIRMKGDLRVRTDRLESERVVGSGETAQVEDAADRDRPRFRARFNAEAQVTENSKVVFGLTSGDGDPRSGNQTFTNTSSAKSVYIDLAYADWTFAPGAKLWLGKHKQPWWRTGQSLFIDADINPEGGAVTFERGMFFGSVYGAMLQENYSSDPDGRNQDPHIFGGQAGVKFPLLGGETRLAAHYYDCGACQGNAPFWGGGNAYGNTTRRFSQGHRPLRILEVHGFLRAGGKRGRNRHPPGGMQGWGGRAGLLRMDVVSHLPPGGDRPLHPGGVQHRASKAWLFSRCLKRSNLIVVSKSIDDKTLKEMFTQRADTAAGAIQMALAKHGENAEIILLQNGSDMIPRFEGK